MIEVTGRALIKRVYLSDLEGLLKRVGIEIVMGGYSASKSGGWLTRSAISGYHVRRGRAEILARGGDKDKTRDGDYREWRRGERVGTSECSSTNQNRGAQRARETT